MHVYSTVRTNNHMVLCVRGFDREKVGVEFDLGESPYSIRYKRQSQNNTKRAAALTRPRARSSFLEPIETGLGPGRGEWLSGQKRKIELNSNPKP